MTDKPAEPLAQTDTTPSPDHQHDGRARRPNDKLDQDRESEETIPRKSSLT